MGDANTIRYGVVPWTAGGLGDRQLLQSDELTAYACQDGGYAPSSKPVEKHEKKKERNKTKKKKKMKVKTLAEQRHEDQEDQLEKEFLEGPHQQEPNQVKCSSPDDGYCDTGLADLIINQIAVEQQNIVTNPLLNAWQDPKGNEATDECRDWFAPVLGGNKRRGGSQRRNWRWNPLQSAVGRRHVLPQRCLQSGCSQVALPGDTLPSGDTA